ncbi:MULTISPECIES: universal stress protein [Maribacter]|uniref:Universal stress protein n=1 Tax=Maribacter flavus TaxID=1658664 RepID=A0A5B2TZU9_9FLAO|nr:MULTISPECIES: universal stress protein [Maribacter]KAA2219869.1 universal stress protein [Maribacter flavus]MDC6405212.1 universal stress protein [Maribacter sp. PR66]MEE1971979.1 universal stress protein [Maribacter flavus]
MKKIILPTDFSENAWNAIFTALKIYSDVKCHFYIVNAYEPGVLKPLGTESHKRLDVIYDSLSQHSEKELAEIQTYLDKNHHNLQHSFETISLGSTLEEAMQKIAKEKDADLIIMGTQGATGAKQVFLGSNTVKVIDKLPNISILAVPDSFNFQKLKTVLYSTDYMKGYDKFELDSLLELVNIWNANIEIIHVTEEFALNETQQTNKNILEERLSGLNFTFVDLPFKSSTAYTIGQYTNNKTSDILGITRHHHTFWEKVIGEPVVKKLAFHSEIPLLILPEK